MLFNSFIFILLFLPLSVAGYFILNKINDNAAKLFLLIMSLWFYGYFNPAYLPIILASVLINHIVARLLIRFDGGKIKKVVLIIGIAFNVLIIGYYKYLSFIEWNLNHFLGTDFVIRSIVLPLGISFYTIQQISFLVDSYNDSNLKYGFLEYALFVAYFPQLVAGPIVYHGELIPQFRDQNKKSINCENLLKGINWFILGLSKKVFIADILGNAVNYGFDNVDSLGTLDVWLVSLCYTLQIYFDFSGYSDMACGIASMFNLELPQNFNSPYKSLSIRDFWKRWHMTLTRFLTRYVYIPLGGSRRGKFATAINTMVVFVVSGIWHGANFTFILWGILHGLLSICNRFTPSKLSDRIPKAIKWFVNFVIIDILWLLFRASGIKEWLLLLKKMFSFNSFDFSLNPELIVSFDSYVPYTLLIIAAMAICLLLKNNYKREKRVNYFTDIVYAALFVGCLMTLNRVSIFLYFNF